MSDDSIKLSAKKREKVGTRYSKRLRDAGGLPAVVYGHGEEPVSISLDSKQATTYISKGEKVFHLDIDGDEQMVLLKDIGYDYLGTNILHADFARVSMDERVDTRAPLSIVGEPVGLKETGAVLMTPAHELELNCLITNLPDEIEVDVSELAVGDSISAGDVTLPKSSMVLLTDPDTVVAQVVIVAEAPSDEAGEVDDAAEPEIVDGKPAEGEAGKAGDGEDK